MHEKAFTLNYESNEAPHEKQPPRAHVTPFRNQIAEANTQPASTSSSSSWNRAEKQIPCAPVTARNHLQSAISSAVHSRNPHVMEKQHATSSETENNIRRLASSAHAWIQDHPNHVHKKQILDPPSARVWNHEPPAPTYTTTTTAPSAHSWNQRDSHMSKKPRHSGYQEPQQVPEKNFQRLPFTVESGAHSWNRTPHLPEEQSGQNLPPAASSWNQEPTVSERRGLPPRATPSWNRELHVPEKETPSVARSSWTQLFSPTPEHQPVVEQIDLTQDNEMDIHEGHLDENEQQQDYCWSPEPHSRFGKHLIIFYSF